MISIPLLIYSQERNPFESFLPEERREERREPELFDISFAPTFTIQGILWGTDNPQAIINGKVYGVGERIRGSNAIVQGIEEEVVLIYFQGRVYKYGTK
ncbi:MAG: hypothetical protein JSW17_05410 [Candidatus Omnitrophota bacterium]|nr:MAG: hypothetical protein JSW17_05410 [Candidatus Omnitrophota bacterium]